MTSGYWLRGRRADRTRQFITEAAKLSPVALICEGTYLNSLQYMTNFNKEKDASKFLK